MRRYETIFIVKSNIGEEEIAGIVEKTTSILTNDGGSIFKIDEWGQKKLAYLIKKESLGYYIYIDYAGTPAAVAEMERIFKIDDRLLKFMTVKLANSCDPEAIIEEMSLEQQKKSAEISEEPAEPSEKPAEPAEPSEKPAEEKAPVAEEKAEEIEESVDTE